MCPFYSSCSVLTPGHEYTVCLEAVAGETSAEYQYMMLIRIAGHTSEIMFLINKSNILWTVFCHPISMTGHVQRQRCLSQPPM